MSKFFRYLRYMAAGVAVAMAGTCAFFAVIAILLLIGDASARLFNLPDKFGMLFFIGYVCILAGGFIGAMRCRDTALPSAGCAPAPENDR